MYRKVLCPTTCFVCVSPIAGQYAVLFSSIREIGHNLVQQSGCSNQADVVSQVVKLHGEMVSHTYSIPFLFFSLPILLSPFYTLVHVCHFTFLMNHKTLHILFLSFFLSFFNLSQCIYLSVQQRRNLTDKYRKHLRLSIVKNKSS